MVDKGKAVVDVLSFAMNISSSVLIVFVNKILMDPVKGYAFVFATCLCCLHFFASAGVVQMIETLGYSKPAKLPIKDTLIFSAIAGSSIATLNLSLLTNSVGFYQISKLMIVPFVCLMEALWLKRKFPLMVLLSVLIVVVGVGIVTVTDVAVNSLGLVVAILSVITSGLQQLLCGVIQRTHNMSSTQLLSNTAPVQGGMLLVAGPFIDKLVSKQWVWDYALTLPGAKYLALSCAIAVFVNISQFMCLGRFSAVTFQVIGHSKTLLVLLLGWMYMNDIMSQRKLSGICLAILGMIAYSYFNSQPTATQAPHPQSTKPRQGRGSAMEKGEKTQEEPLDGQP